MRALECTGGAVRRPADAFLVDSKWIDYVEVGREI